MKKKLPYVMSIVFFLIAVVFAGLWVHGKYEQAEFAEFMELSCKNSIQQSFEHFTAYEKSGADEEYRYGVSKYNSFMEAYILLCDGKQQPNHNELNRAYGSMILEEEKVQENMDQLLSALTLFSKDIYDPNAMIKLNEFNHSIESD